MIKRKLFYSLGTLVFGATWFSMAGCSSTSATPNTAPKRPAAVAPALLHPQVISVELEWFDAQRKRVVAARLHLPRSAVQAKSQSPLPLVVVSHGLGGSRAGYSYLGRHWAEQGFASLHVQHPGSDRDVWFSNPFGVLRNLQRAASDDNAKDRVTDISFALDRLTADLQANGGQIPVPVDTSHVTIAGHSYGANTAMMLAGAQPVRNDQALNLRDPRIRAAILMSSPPFYGETNTRSILQMVGIPTLHLTGTQDVIRVPGYYSAPSDRVAIYDAMPKGEKSLVVFRDGTHSIFTDRIDQAGAALNAEVKSATRQLTSAFLHSYGRPDRASGRASPSVYGVTFDQFIKSSGTLIDKADRS
jgi:predicted dienelactone hydrolase